MTANVATRVMDKAHDTKETAQVKTEEVKQQAQAKAKEVKRHVHDGTEALQAKAGEVALPLIATARQRPIPTTAVAVGVLLVLLLVLRRLLRGS
jgi:ElaB/YqjD/DUF883 family membrane-anchored ribosome-binding protein